MNLERSSIPRTREGLDEMDHLVDLYNTGRVMERKAREKQHDAVTGLLALGISLRLTESILEAGQQSFTSMLKHPRDEWARRSWLKKQLP